MSQNEELVKIIGLKVIALKGFKCGRRKYARQIDFVFFDDQKTFIQLEEQGQEYHDADFRARVIRVTVDPIAYNNMITWSELADPEPPKEPKR